MNTTQENPQAEPARADIDQLPGATVLEFGAGWCGHCQAAQPLIAAALAAYPQTRHIRIEDGKGRRLGRTYAVKLWPTLIFLNNGTEIARLVRPLDSASIAAALHALNN
ncbi:MAG: thioredoxin family protein [Sulfuriferula sp.]|nr:thioredoxin family protein [Sulfuriferula sp.]